MQPAGSIVAATYDWQGSLQPKRTCGCSKKCIIALVSVFVVIIALVVAVVVLLFVLDRNQCARAINMQYCVYNDYACLLKPVYYKRKLLKQYCIANDLTVSRKLSYTNTIEYDQYDRYYCVFDGIQQAYVTIELDAQPAEFLHKGACGACSNQQDYQKYQETAMNLTQYTKNAAVLSIFRRKSAMAKMKSAGFTYYCSECWVENMENTIVHCLGPCIFGSRKSCGKDGKLTKCLQCDENYSGLYFRRCAGMTRRRAGIASDICRQDGEIIDKNE